MNWEKIDRVMDYVTLAMIAITFASSTVVMVRRTEVWDRLGRALVALFAMFFGLFLYAMARRVFPELDDAVWRWPVRLIVLGTSGHFLLALFRVPTERKRGAGQDIAAGRSG